MASPSLELQGTIVARLKADSSVTALVGARVYETVPPEEERHARTGAAFPYVSMGPADELSDDAECINGFEIALQVDVWSRAVGSPEAKTIADAIRTSLRDYDFPLVSNALVLFQHQQTRFLRDPDGLTTHGIIIFEAFIEQP